MRDTRRDVQRNTSPTGTTPPPSKATADSGSAQEASGSKKASPSKKASAAPTAKEKPTSKPAASSQRTTSADDRRRMIAEAAYFRAQQRGFMQGDEINDWLDAEREVDLRLGAH